MTYRYTRTGDRHIRQGVPCDDAAAAVQDGSCTAMFTADGCSSSLFGGESARRITERLADMIRNPHSVLRADTPITSEDLIRYFIDPDNNDDGIRLLFTEIEKEAQAMCRLYQCQRNHICCTLIAAFVQYDPDSSSNSAAVFTVGDGFVAAYNRRHGSTVLISQGENIDGNLNRTYFCTSQDASAHVHAYYVDNFDGLLLSSDGITHAVDIGDPDELAQLMEHTSLAAGITDARFSAGMDRMLSACIRERPGARDLEDDCSAVYYSTDKKLIRRAIKN